MNNLNMVVQAIIWKSEAPISGYDIAKKISGKTGNSHQQIYRELAKLAKRDDILVDTIPQSGKPDRKVYRFKSKEKFVTMTGESSDFTKSKVAYELLIGDVINDTDECTAYLEHMKAAELAFLALGDSAKEAGKSLLGLSQSIEEAAKND